MSVKLGYIFRDVPRHPGSWSVWSQAPGPSSYFLVPADDEARATGRTSVTVRIKRDRFNPEKLTAEVV